MSLRLTLPIIFFVSVAISGCASVVSFKNKIVRGASQGQIEPASQVIKLKKVTPNKAAKIIKPKTIRAPSNNCSYIVRDLSIPKATAVWCLPKVQRR